MVLSETAGMAPVMAFALVGALGVGSQWLAWKLQLPAIVLMLVAGLIIGPGLGVFDPVRDIGPLMAPMISIAVAIILFEGGLSLTFKSLQDAAKGVQRLVVVGAPVGWLLSAAALHWVAGLSWASSAVFGGILIVTGPTVIAPLLRQARLKRRPAALLQWEAIVNDPVGALAAVLALQVVLVWQARETTGEAIWDLSIGIVFAAVLGLAAGAGLAWSFRRAKVPEYMKVPVLFVVLLLVFAVADHVLHESGLLAVTIMGLWIANADLPSYTELRRFKEQATVLLVSGVFILLAASMSLDTLGMLTWRAGFFIAVVILIVRPLTVFVSLAFSDIPWAERVLVAFTGPRGVVLVAVAGLFAERLVDQGFEDAAVIAPLAFALVAATVVLNGFTLTPFARALGLTASDAPGVLIVGGSEWSVGFAQALQKLELPVLIADPNHAHLRAARRAGVPSYFGDILSEAAEHSLDFISFQKVVAATDNDAYNTLVCTDLAPEFGRENVFQPAAVKYETPRHALPAGLGGRRLQGDLSHYAANDLMAQGWRFRVTSLTKEFTAENWLDKNPEAVPLAEYDGKNKLRILDRNAQLKAEPGTQIIAFCPPAPAEQAAARH